MCGWGTALRLESVPMAGTTQALKQRIDHWQQSNASASVGYGVVKKYGEDKGSQLSALITYYGFFSLFPALLAAFTILGFVLQGNAEFRERIAETISERLPLPGIDATSLKGSGFALLAGLLLALWSGLGATQVLQDAIQKVFRAENSAPSSFLVRRLLGLRLLAVVGFGVVASAASTALVASLPLGGKIGGLIAGVGINALVTAALIKLSVPKLVSWVDLRWAALFGGLGWTLLGSIGAWYTERLVSNSDKTYGVFAVVIGLLSWIYLQAQVLVYAAEIGAVTHQRLYPRSLLKDTPTAIDTELSASERSATTGPTK